MLGGNPELLSEGHWNSENADKLRCFFKTLNLLLESVYWEHEVADTVWINQEGTVFSSCTDTDMTSWLLRVIL